MRRLALAIALLVAPAARAHHVVSEYGIAPAEPRTVVQLDTRVGAFDLDAARGVWFSPTLRAEVAPIPWFSVSARLPFAAVAYSEGSTVGGLSDAELGVRARVVATPHGELLLSTGLGLELPTGAPKVGLGNGHVELSPFVVASTSPTSWLTVYTVLTDAIALSKEHAHGAGFVGHMGESVLAPHSPHELRARLGVAAVVGASYLSIRSDGVVRWTEVAGGPLTVGAEVGTRVHPNVRLALSVDVPVAGEHRYEWQTGLGASWSVPRRERHAPAPSETGSAQSGSDEHPHDDPRG